MPGIFFQSRDDAVWLKPNKPPYLDDGNFPALVQVVNGSRSALQQLGHPVLVD